MLAKFSERLHERDEKEPFDMFDTYINFTLLAFTIVVPLADLVSIGHSYRLDDSLGRRQVLTYGSALVIFGSLLTAWFPDVILEFIGLIISGFGVGSCIRLVRTYTFI